MGQRIAIAGASGYAGGELLRLVAAHPDLEVGTVAAHGAAGRRVGDVHPNLRSVADLVFAPTEAELLADADLVFLALPHGASAALAAELDPHQRVVDLGSDHRLRIQARTRATTAASSMAPGPMDCRNSQVRARRSPARPASPTPAATPSR